MTVRELLAKLADANPDAEVWIDSYPADTCEVRGSTVTISGEELQGALDNDPGNGY